MPLQPIHNPKDYSESINQIQLTDLVHPSVLNPLFETLINNDAFIKALVDKLMSSTQGHKHSGVDGDAPKLNPATALTYVPINKAGDTMTGQLVLSGDPTSALHAATKQYVDSVVAGLDVKKSCKAATTGNITLSGIQTIDGVALSVGDRVLVKNQTTASQNGIYVVQNGAWVRGGSSDSNNELTPGAFTFIEQGTVNGDTGWILSTDGTITVGTTPITWTQFSSAGVITVDTTLNKSGNTIGLKSGIVTAGTYGKVTVDTYGRVTAGMALAAADIPNLDWSKITSGKPTTLAGYGITDAYTKATADSTFATKADVNAAGKTASGSYTGDGTANRNINVGFQPKLVVIYGNSRRFEALPNVTSVMSENQTFESKNYILNDASAFVGINATGFTLGNTAASVSNTTGQTYTYVAVG
jgi:hypothetical protein